jgi:hypothetical protein
MATRMQQRRGTAAQWISTNSGNGPILNAGEIGYETDTNKFKIGDGTNHWINLDYFIDANSTANPSFGTSIVFEGAVSNDYETTLTVAEPTGDRTITFPDATGIVVLSDINGNVTIPGSLTITGATTTIDSTVINLQNELKFEGTTVNDFETSLLGGDPTADRTITLPDLTGTVVLDQGAQTLYTKSINLNSNILTGTAAEFNAALSDADFATLAGTQTLTNKTLTSPNVNEAVALLATATELNVLDGITSSTAELNILDGVTSTAAELNILDGVTSSTAELNILDGVTATTAELNKLAGVTATSAEINILAGLTSTAAELNILDGATLSVTELNYVDGVTSAIQTQLNNKQAVVTDVSDTEIGYLNGVTSDIQTQIDAKAALSSPTFTGTVVLPSGTVTSTMILDGTIVNADISATAAIDWTKISASSTISETELGYLDGVTSAIQTQLNGKQATVLNVSDVEIGYLDGVTSAIQTQMDAKAPLASPTFTGTVTLPSGAVTSTMILDGTILNEDINAAAAIDWTKLGISSTVSSTEIGYVDGVTSAIQTQLDAKSPLASPTFTGTVNAADLILSGDLTINGTTTTINSTTLAVDDKNIVIGDVTTPSDVTADGGGITLKGATDKTFNWVDATDSWTSSEHINLASGKDLKVNGTSVISSTAGGFIFTDGTQTLEGTPSRTPIVQKTDSYTLSALTHRDSLIEVAKASATTITIPLNSAVAYPVGTSIDILQSSTGQVTIAGDAGVTVNATPGLKLRTQWSTATLFKRAENIWVVYGDLTA